MEKGMEDMEERKKVENKSYMKKKRQKREKFGNKRVRMPKINGTVNAQIRKGERTRKKGET